MDLRKKFSKFSELCSNRGEYWGLGYNFLGDHVKIAEQSSWLSISIFFSGLRNDYHLKYNCLKFCFRIRASSNKCHFHMNLEARRNYLVDLYQWDNLFITKITFSFNIFIFYHNAQSIQRKCADGPSFPFFLQNWMVKKEWASIFFENHFLTVFVSVKEASYLILITWIPTITSIRRCPAFSIWYHLNRALLRIVWLC